MPTEEEGFGSKAKSLASKVASRREKVLRDELANVLFRVYHTPISYPAYALKAYARLAAFLEETYSVVEPDPEDRKRKMNPPEFEAWRDLRTGYIDAMHVFGDGNEFADRLHALIVHAHGVAEREAEEEERSLDVYDLASDLSTVSSKETHLYLMTDDDLRKAANYIGKSDFGGFVDAALRLGEDEPDWMQKMTNPGAKLDEMRELIKADTFHPAGYD